MMFYSGEIDNPSDKAPFMHKSLFWREININLQFWDKKFSYKT